MKFLITVILSIISTLLCVANTNERILAHSKLKECYKYREEGNWIDALNSLHEFISLYGSDTSYENMSDCAQAYILLGNIHMGFSDYVNAQKYYLRCLDLAKKTSDNNMITDVCGNLAVAYCDLHEKEKAYNSLAQSRSIKTDNPVLHTISNDIIDAYLERNFGDWQKAVDKQKKVLASIVASDHNPRKQATPLSEITEMYEEHDMIDSAFHYLGMYEQLVTKYKIVDMMTDCQRIKMRLFTKTGKTDSALFYQDRYLVLKDSLMNNRNFLQLASSFRNAQEEKDGRKIESLQITIGRQNVTMLIGGLVLLIIAGGCVVIYLQFKKVRANNISLYEKNRELEALERQTNIPAAADTSESSVDGSDNIDSIYPGLRNKILTTMSESKEWLDPDFNLQRLADLVDSNTRYVSQVINDGLQKNFRTFINEYRIREAKAMMCDTDKYGHLTIQTIGEMVGFKSSSNFISAFKKQTGLTPSFYQKMTLADEANKR